MMTESSSNGVADLYFCDLPANERNALCKLLHEQSSWQQLAEEMKLEIKDIKETAKSFKTTESKIVLTTWGIIMNHTITELFVVLSRVSNYKAMLLIKNRVAPKYHQLIKHSTQNQTVPPGFNANLPQTGYQELRDATNDFSPARVLGTGGFGTVYRGTWKYMEVAIKMIKSRDTPFAKFQIKQSLNELRCLYSCRHGNILPLYAYSMDGEAPCLVYELMTGGSVAQRLRNSRPEMVLQWQQRMDIAVGTVKGLHFLHTFSIKPLIHGDIKPANILLDNSTQPKIGDFGLAREGNYNDAELQVSRVFGTEPYMSPEFYLYKTLSTKVDMFSFGVVLLELATGMRAANKSYTFLSQHVRTFDESREVELMDTKPIRNERSDAIFRCMMRQGKICSDPDAVKRPADMVKVLEELQYSV